MTAASHADEAVAADSVPNVQEVPKRKWTSYIWDTFDKSPEERRLLFKLDTAILTFASLGQLFILLKLLSGLRTWLTLYELGYFIKYLDQININNAFVSGMYVKPHRLFWH
jgi:multisubunit Na+/H+ antiporter MnhB subunit